MRYWDIDIDAFAQACDVLLLEEPVTVRVSQITGGPDPSKYITQSSYQVSEDPHLIVVDPRCPYDEVSSTLWHELRHAQQRERGHDIPVTAEAFGSNFDAYEEHPLEQEEQEEQEAKQTFLGSPLVRFRPSLRTYVAWEFNPRTISFEPA